MDDSGSYALRPKAFLSGNKTFPQNEERLGLVKTFALDVGAAVGCVFFSRGELVGNPSAEQRQILAEVPCFVFC